MFVADTDQSYTNLSSDQGTSHRRQARIAAIRAGLTEDEYRTAMELSSTDDDEANEVEDAARPTGHMGRYQRKVQKLLKQKAAEKMPVYRHYSNAEFLETARTARETSERWLMEVGGWTQSNTDPLIKHHEHKVYGRVFYVTVG